MEDGAQWGGSRQGEEERNLKKKAKEKLTPHIGGVHGWEADMSDIPRFKKSMKVPSIKNVAWNIYITIYKWRYS